MIFQSDFFFFFYSPFQFCAGWWRCWLWDFQSDFRKLSVTSLAGLRKRRERTNRYGTILGIEKNRRVWQWVPECNQNQNSLFGISSPACKTVRIPAMPTNDGSRRSEWCRERVNVPWSRREWEETLLFWPKVQETIIIGCYLSQVKKSLCNSDQKGVWALAGIERWQLTEKVWHTGVICTCHI